MFLLPVSNPLLQLSQQVTVELVQLRQMTQDLVQDLLVDYGFPCLTGGLQYRFTEILQGKKKWYYMRENETIILDAITKTFYHQ